MMMGKHFMGPAPFPTVYIHGIVRDEKGQKMSKSKGNVIDPLDLIEEYGADALRFTMAALATAGRDVKPSKARIEGYRNFATKLWNAARFCEMNDCLPGRRFTPGEAKSTLNRWIVGETDRTASEVTRAIETHKYNEAAAAIYHFVWHVFCDWYLELIKPALTGDDEAVAAETRAAAAWTLDRILALLHPFMPFITEELWVRLAETAGVERPSPLILAPWPGESGHADEAADAEIGWLIRLVSDIRSVRAEMNVPAGAQLPCVIVGAGAETRRRAEDWRSEITRLARLSEIRFADSVPPGSVQIVLCEATVSLPIAEVVDLEAERVRLARELEKTASEIAALEAKLANQNFIARAPEHVVEAQRERKAEAQATRARLEAAIERLKGAA